MTCPKCHGQDIGPLTNTSLELVNQCQSCGYWFDRAADGPEIGIILSFYLFPDGWIDSREQNEARRRRYAVPIDNR